MYSTPDHKLLAPQLIAVSTNGALAKLSSSLDCDSLPNIDIEALLSLAIDTLVHLESVPAEVANLVKNVLELDESICHCLKQDRVNIPTTVLEKTTSALIVLIDTVRNCLFNGGLYENGFLHYEFARIADHDNLLLRRIGG